MSDLSPYDTLLKSKQHMACAFGGTQVARVPFTWPLRPEGSGDNILHHSLESQAGTSGLWFLKQLVGSGDSFTLPLT